MTSALLPLLLQAATPVPQQPPAPVSDDIVVTGLRDLEDPDSAVTRGTLGSSKVGNATRSRVRFNAVETFTSCAGRNPARGRGQLRAALDGVTYSTRQMFAQNRYIALSASCSTDPPRALAEHGIDDPYYDRGGLVLYALQTYAADARLTKRETGDPEVQARFDRREVPLARFRLPVDRTYFEAAVCFVRLQPELSVRLVRAGLPYASVGRLEAAIVNGGRPCVGNAHRVYFDPTQFRFYIADAVYRWLVAARGVGSLVPADGDAGD